MGVRLLTLALLWLGLCSCRAGADQQPSAPDAASPSGAPTLPTSVDLRPAFEKWGLTGRKQGKRNTCSVFTVAGALEFAAANKRQHGERFSVEFLNWGANKVVGDAEDGAFFSDLWSAFATYGICLEKSKVPVRDGMGEFDTLLAIGRARAALGYAPRFSWRTELK